MPQQTLKLTLIGNQKAGKTALINRLAGNPFDFTSPTISNITQHTLPAGDKVEIYDNTAKLPYKNTNIICLCVDLSDLDNADIKEWATEAYRYAPDGASIAIIGTKKDLLDEANTASIQAEIQRHIGTLEEVPSGRDVIGFYQTSAKTGEGIEEAFSEMVKAKIAEEAERAEEAKAAETAKKPRLLERLSVFLGGSKAKPAVNAPAAQTPPPEATAAKGQTQCMKLKALKLRIVYLRNQKTEAEKEIGLIEHDPNTLKKLQTKLAELAKELTATQCKIDILQEATAPAPNSFNSLSATFAAPPSAEASAKAAEYLSAQCSHPQESAAEEMKEFKRETKP